MARELRDLTEVMEAESARGVPSPDLLDGVRRRVRRGNRLRAAAAAFGVVLMAGAAFGVVQQQDGNARDRHALAPMMAGVVNQDFPRSAGRDGMQPLQEVGFSQLRAKGRFTITPTGPFIGVTLRCSGDFMVYQQRENGAFSSGGCSQGSPDDNSTSVSKVTPGVPITIEVVALPLKDSSEQNPNTLSSMIGIDRYLGSHEPTSGNWSVRVYSGQCNTDACNMGTRPPTQPKQLAVTGLKRLARVTGSADGRPRTVPLNEPGKLMRIRVTCVDGAAVAVVRTGGQTKVVNCEIAESTGITWDQDVEGGTNAIKIAVLPAEAGKVHATSDAALAKLMKSVKPAGKWTLEVYAR